jgi:hypothetical protein
MDGLSSYMNLILTHYKSEFVRTNLESAFLILELVRLERKVSF